MAIIAKAPQPTVSLIADRNTVTPNEKNIPLDPKLQRVKEAAAKGDYQQALELLPADSQVPEIRNCRAVCLIRLNRFEDAFSVLRRLVVNEGTQGVRPEVPDHIKISFATALFYGGLPPGGLEVLAETRREDDPEVKQLRQATAHWVAGMSLLSRFDWKLNRIAPKKLPNVPQEKLGRFIWEVA